jgi:hypothetical protein
VALDVGDSVDLSWKTKGRPNTTDQIGGQPELVRAGDNVAPGPDAGTSYFYDRNPRTGVGITRGCTDRSADTACYVYLITVDGRQTGWSRGMTLTRFAAEFLAQSPPAYYAVNLDGGGSTEMWVARRRATYCQTHPPVGGCTVNRPSGGHERPVTTTLQVLAGADPGEPDLSGAPSPISGKALTRPAVDVADWLLLTSQDPGSTGGLFDAIASGGMGKVPASADFRSTLRSYRRALASGRVARLVRGR